MGIFDIMLHVRRLMMFGLAVLIGFLFQYMAIPIPFLLGGIVSSMFWKVIGAQVCQSAKLRNGLYARRAYANDAHERNRQAR